MQHTRMHHVISCRAIAVFAVVFYSATWSAVSSSYAYQDGTLYGVDTLSGNLIEVDRATGAGTVVGTVGLNAIVGLAYDSTTDTLFGFDSGFQVLISIDRDTGEGTAIGTPGFVNVAGLAFDCNSNTLFATETFDDQLITIDPVTGAGAAVGPIGFQNIFGFTFDSSTNTLFGIASFTDELITVDPLTGNGNLIGPHGFTNVTGLAFDPSTNTLFGTDNVTDELIVVDRSTGVGTVVGALGFANVSSLAYVPETNVVLQNVSIGHGRAKGGGLENLRYSDDSYFDVRANDGVQNIEVEFEGVSPFINPDSLTVSLEAHTNMTGVKQTIEIFNWRDGNYEPLDASFASFNEDSVVSVALESETMETPSEVSDYVQSGTRLIRTRSRWRAIMSNNQAPLTVQVDKTAWNVTEIPPEPPETAYVTSGGGNDGNDEITLGWTFRPVVDISVQSLGVFDFGSDGPGLETSHEVGLWRSEDGELIAKTTVPQGFVGKLVDGFRFQKIVAVTLEAGIEYTIGAYYPNNMMGDKTISGTPVSSPHINLLQASRLAFGQELTFPNTFSSNWRSSANFTFSAVGDIGQTDFVATDNLVISKDRFLVELTSDGTQVRLLSIVPYPGKNQANIRATDAVVGPAREKIHVLNTSPFAENFLSTLDVHTGQWTHILDPFYGQGGVPDGDLSIFGNWVVSRTSLYNLEERTVTPLNIENTAEVSFGLDGFLYATGNGFQTSRAEIRVFDPDNLQQIRKLTLMNGDNFVNTRGIAVDSNRDIFAVDGGSLIYRFDADGILINAADAGVVDFVDINIRSDGTIAAGTNRDIVVLTNRSLGPISLVTPTIGDGDLIYVAWASSFIQETHQPGIGNSNNHYWTIDECTGVDRIRPDAD